MSRMLYIFVEGPDDQRFFNWYFTGNYRLIPYSKEKKVKINNFIKSILSMPNSNYIFVKDSDNKSIPDAIVCVLNTFSAIRDQNNVIIVQKEIECWYLAGLTFDSCEKMKVRFYPSTNDLTKEDFNKVIPRCFERIEFMQYILTNYDIDGANRRNNTFGNFNKRYK